MNSNTSPSRLIVYLIAFVLTSSISLEAQTRPGPVNIDELLREPVQPDRALAYFHFSRAKLFEKEDNWERAEEELRKALALDPDSSDLRSQAASFFIRVQKFSEAIQYCKDAIELDADNAEAHYVLGSIYSAVEGRPQFEVSGEDAIREFREVLRIEPNHPSAQFRIADIYLRNQQADKAVGELEAFNDRTGGNSESYFFLALAYEQLDRISDAIAAIQEALRTQPDSRYLRLFTSLISKSGDDKLAIDAYRKLLESGSANRDIKKRLAEALLMENNFAESVQLLEEVLREEPDDLASLIQLGRGYLGLRDFKRAHDSFGKALQLDSANLSAKFYRAYTFEEQGHTDQAVEAFQEILRDTYDPSGKYSPQIFDNRLLFRRHIAFIYQDSGQFEKAVEEFQTILGMQDTADNHRMVINAMRLAKRETEALELSRKAFEKYPKDKFLALNHSQLVAEVEDFSEGEQLARNLLRENPKDPDYYLSLSQIYLNAKKYTPAETTLKEALDFSTEERIKFQLGAVYERAKSYDKAEQQFQEIIESNPQNASALNYLGYMWADQGIRLDEALEYIQKAVDMDPGNGAYLDSLGWVYFKLDKLQQAEEYLTAAIERAKNDPTIHEHLGDLYFARGLYEKAQGAWQDALRHGTEDEEITKVREKLDRLKKLMKKMN